jgi:hypothetical protein
MELLREIVSRKEWLKLQQELVELGFDTKLTSDGLKVTADFKKNSLKIEGTVKREGTRYSSSFGDTSLSGVLSTKLIIDSLLEVCLDDLCQQEEGHAYRWLSGEKRSALLSALLHGKEVRFVSFDDTTDDPEEPIPAPGPGWERFDDCGGAHDYDPEAIFVK